MADTLRQKALAWFRAREDGGRKASRLVATAVSYTHLDVYKRQVVALWLAGVPRRSRFRVAWR